MAELTWQSEITCPSCGNELELLTQRVRTSRDHVAVLQCRAPSCREPWLLTRTLEPVRRLSMVEAKLDARLGKTG